MNLNRVEGREFKPLYERIDALKGGMNAREAAITRLEREQHEFDRPAVQKGLITVGGMTVSLLVALTVLVVMMAR